MNGRLKIKSNDTGLLGSVIEIDGKKFPITDITLSGNITENVWKVEASFYAKGVDIDLVAEIKSMKKKES